GGAVAGALLAQIRETVAQLQQADAGDAHTQGIALIARQLGLAADAFEHAGNYLLNHARAEVSAVFLGSVPYLQLAGTVLSGWQLARAAQAGLTHIAQNDTNPFYRRKIGTAVFYAADI